MAKQLITNKELLKFLGIEDMYVTGARIDIIPDELPTVTIYKKMPNDVLVQTDFHLTLVNKDEEHDSDI